MVREEPRPRLPVSGQPVIILWAVGVEVDLSAGMDLCGPDQYPLQRSLVDRGLHSLAQRGGRSAAVRRCHKNHRVRIRWESHCSCSAEGMSSVGALSEGGTAGSWIGPSMAPAGGSCLLEEPVDILDISAGRLGVVSVYRHILVLDSAKQVIHDPITSSRYWAVARHLGVS